MQAPFGVRSLIREYFRVNVVHVVEEGRQGA